MSVFWTYFARNRSTLFSDFNNGDTNGDLYLIDAHLDFFQFFITMQKTLPLFVLSFNYGNWMTFFVDIGRKCLICGKFEFTNVEICVSDPLPLSVPATCR